MPFFALRAFDAGIFGFFQRFDVLAFGVVGAADEFAAGAAVFVNQLAAAFGALAAFEFGLFGGFLRGAFGGLFGGFVNVAGVAAFGVAGAGNEAAVAAELDLQFVVAAFGAGFVEFLGGEFGALDAFFFFNLFVETFPEFVHHRYPLAFAVGDFVELVFEFGGEVVVDVLGEVFGEEFVDDFAGVGRGEAFLLKGNVFAVFERGNDAGVGGRAADAVFFERFHQGGFVEAGRRGGEVLFAVDVVDGQGFAFGHFGQFFVFFAFVFVVGAFFIHA